MKNQERDKTICRALYAGESAWSLAIVFDLSEKRIRQIGKEARSPLYVGKYGIMTIREWLQKYIWYYRSKAELVKACASQLGVNRGSVYQFFRF